MSCLYSSLLLLKFLKLGISIAAAAFHVWEKPSQSIGPCSFCRHSAVSSLRPIGIDSNVLLKFHMSPDPNQLVTHAFMAHALLPIYYRADLNSGGKAKGPYS